MVKSENTMFNGVNATNTVTSVEHVNQASQVINHFFRHQVNSGLAAVGFLCIQRLSSGGLF
jgi:hypothetical protein